MRRWERESNNRLEVFQCNQSLSLLEIRFAIHLFIVKLYIAIASERALIHYFCLKLK